MNCKPMSILRTSCKTCDAVGICNANSEIKRLTEELEKARAALEVVDAVSIVANISHSIKEGESLVAWVKRILKEEKDEVSE